MRLQVLLVVIGSVLLGLLPPASLVLGQRQPKKCSEREKCTAIRDCAEFSSYVGQPSKTWPKSVQNEVLKQYCGTEVRGTDKVHKVCCSTVVRFGDSSSTQSKKGLQLLDLDKCGKTQATDRIANGEVAEVFQFPWMALLRGIEEKFHCGGALIAERYVLTAAHCNRIRVWYVRLGETDLSTETDCNTFSNGEQDCAEPPQDIPVERFIRHRYSVSQKKNDIALVKLARPAQLNFNVVPICLPLPEVSRSVLPNNMTVSGWGYTEITKDISDQLRYAHIPIVELARCNQTMRIAKTDWSVDESQVCAGAGDDKADNCHGDSGGPLQYFGQRSYVIHGIVSYGLASCGTQAEPGVYTKVSHYLDWIIANLT